MTRRSIITDHALVRWLERHDGLDLSGVRETAGGDLASDGDVLDVLARDYGLDVGAFRRQLATPAVVAAVGSGASAVIVGGVRLIIVDGRVVTIKYLTNIGRRRKVPRDPRPRQSTSEALRDQLDEVAW